MAAIGAIEQLQTYWEPEIIERPPELPLVIAVPEMLEDELARKRAERLIRGAGRTVLEATAAAIPERSEAPITSLMNAIHRAAIGDETARKLVETNVRTDAIERTIKAGHIMRVELDTDEQGRITQYGQNLESIQTNTLRYASDQPQMRARAEAETRNAYRLDMVHRTGLLEAYNFVVFSRAADDMTRQAMTEAGFFVDTMSTAVQVVSAEAGGLAMEVAFVAGADTPGGSRFDRQLTSMAGDVLGVNLQKSATETIDTPLLIRKDAMPNGATDLVWLLDSLKGAQKEPAQYLDYRQQCAERERGFEPKVQAIVEDLLAESASITTPPSATERLHKLSEAHMVDKAIEDDTIDPVVFGHEAAWHIEHARWLQEQGDAEAARQQGAKAKETARSDSCPGGAGSQGEAGGDKTAAGGGGPSSGGSEAGGDCEFVSKKCPKCGKKNVKTVVKKGKYHGECGCKSD